MSTGYGWEGIKQVCATLLGARHVPECLCGGSVYLGRYNKCSTFTFLPLDVKIQKINGPVIRNGRGAKLTKKRKEVLTKRGK